jgi:hypothetical protein
MPSLATRFARNSHVLRSDTPLSDDQIRRVAPSIFATSAHTSCSERYAQIPTADVLKGLRKEGFEPFMVCQSRSRLEDRRDFTKHMIRLRHASQIRSAEAHEIVLLNAHDRSSSYQMLSGVFRFVCQNGLISGNELADIRIPHRGDVTGRVIEGAYVVLENAPRIADQVAQMKAIRLNDDEQRVFARTAIELRFDVSDVKPAPVTETQVLRAQRHEDGDASLWTTFNRVQEHLIGGGMRGRNPQGRRMTTRPVEGIDSNTKLNRALWSLAERMQQLKA